MFDDICTEGVGCEMLTGSSNGREEGRKGGRWAKERESVFVEKGRETGYKEKSERATEKRWVRGIARMHPPVCRLLDAGRCSTNYLST